VSDEDAQKKDGEMKKGTTDDSCTKSACECSAATGRQRGSRAEGAWGKKSCASHTHTHTHTLVKHRVFILVLLPSPLSYKSREAQYIFFSSSDLRGAEDVYMSLIF